MEQPTPDPPFVGLEATREGVVVSWDLPAERFEAARIFLESLGWNVVGIIGEGPRRRMQPRIENL
jgi:hypothetical protein